MVGFKRNRDDNVSHPLSSNANANQPTFSAKGKNHRLLIASLVVGILFLFTIGIYFLYQGRLSNKQPPKVKIGVLLPFSGGLSNFGYGAMKGILLAKRELAASNLELLIVDSKCDDDSARAAMTSLVEKDVVAIIGAGCTTASAAVLEIANANKIIMISPSAAGPVLSIPGDYFFRMVPPNDFQGAFMAEIMYDRGLRNIAVFSSNQPYSRGLTNGFQKKLEQLGGRVVATASADPEAVDLEAQAQSLNASNADSILVAASSPLSAAAFVKITRQINPSVPLFGTDVMYDSAIIENVGSASDGIIITSFPVGNNPFQQSLVSEYQKTEQLYGAAQGYDILNLLYLAVESSNTSGQTIKNFLEQAELTGKSGRIVFDENGDIAGSGYNYDLFRIKNGSFVYVEHE